MAIDFKSFGKFKVDWTDYDGIKVQAAVPDPNPLAENFHDYMERNKAQAWPYFLVVQDDGVIRVIYYDYNWAQSHIGCEIIGVNNIGNVPMVDRPRPSWDAANSVIVPGVVPPEPLPVISLRQFYQLAANLGYITRQQALDAMDGVIPPPLTDLIAKMTPDDAFAAQMLLKGAINVEAANSLVKEVANAMGMTEDSIKNFFLEASKL